MTICTLPCKLTVVCSLIQVHSVAHTFLTCTGIFTLTPMLTHMFTHTYTLTYINNLLFIDTLTHTLVLAVYSALGYL